MTLNRVEQCCQFIWSGISSRLAHLLSTNGRKQHTRYWCTNCKLSIMSGIILSIPAVLHCAANASKYTNKQEPGLGTQSTEVSQYLWENSGNRARVQRWEGLVKSGRTMMVSFQWPVPHLCLLRESRASARLFCALEETCWKLQFCSA